MLRAPVPLKLRRKSHLTDGSHFIKIKSKIKNLFPRGRTNISIMKTKANKIARILVLPILLMFSTATFAGNTLGLKNNDCKCVACCCKDCKEACGSICDGKCCTDKAGACSKEMKSGSCCKTATNAAGTSCNKEEKAGSCCKTKTDANTTDAKGSTADVKAGESKSSCCKSKGGNTK